MELFFFLVFLAWILLLSPGLCRVCFPLIPREVGAEKRGSAGTRVGHSMDFPARD